MYTEKTKVWKINGDTLVVANTAEKAIYAYKNYNSVEDYEDDPIVESVVMEGDAIIVK